MKPDREFSDLIGRIYDCALDSSQWPDVLARITEALNGVTADLNVVDPIAGILRIAAFHNWPQDVLELAMAHFSITPARGAILTLPLLEPMCTSRHLDIKAFHNSRYWKTCFAGRGYYNYLVARLATPGSHSMMAGMDQMSELDRYRRAQSCHRRMQKAQPTRRACCTAAAVHHSDAQEVARAAPDAQTALAELNRLMDRRRAVEGHLMRVRGQLRPCSRKNRVGGHPLHLPLIRSPSDEPTGTPLEPSARRTRVTDL